MLPMILSSVPLHHIAHAEREMAVNTVAVLGAGHGGCAAAADLGTRGYSVRLHARNAERLAPLRAQGGIEARGIVQGLVPIDLMTTDVVEAVRGADLIMLVVPSVAHGHYARALAPLLDGSQPIFINPGHTGGGLHFLRELRNAGYRGPVRSCETVTLTYITRMEGPATRQHLQLHQAAALRRASGQATPTRCSHWSSRSIPEIRRRAACSKPRCRTSTRYFTRRA